MNHSRINILYEDADVLAVEKPSGLMVHGTGRSQETTLCDILLERFPDIANVGEPLVLPSGKEVPRPGVVHRLDRETSGVMLVARTPRAFAFLKRQFQSREIQKEYRAFAWGKFSPPHGRIDVSLGRSKKDFRQYAAPIRARGEMRESLTYYETLYAGKENGRDISFMKAVPKTGRTHQIRAHFASAGHPILCDRLYGKKEGSALKLDRLALHAFSIVFRSPEAGERRVESPLPQEFERALQMLKTESVQEN